MLGVQKRQILNPPHHFWHMYWRSGSEPFKLALRVRLPRVSPNRRHDAVLRFNMSVVRQAILHLVENQTP